MKIKIIFFLSPEVTGAERVTITMARQYNREKYDIVFAIIGETLGEIASFIPHEQLYCLVPFLRLEKKKKKERPDQVFCSLIHLNAEVLNAAREVGHVKVILRNNYNLIDVNNELLDKAKYAYPRADEVIAQTEQMKLELINVCGVSEDKIKVIDNPVDTEYIDEKLKGVSSPYPNDGMTHFCWVGRYDYIKGVDILIDAFAQASQKDSHISLYMIGSIDENNVYYQNMKDKVEAEHLTQKIHFIGFQDNPYQWMKYADCLIIPSRSEANSNIQKEADYIGTPVIVTCISNEMAQLIVNHNKQIN